MTTQANPQFARYVFMDVVSFSHERSVEAQTDIVAALNETVSTAMALFDLKPDGSLLLPTGDGLCIAILDPAAPYDIHLSTALLILNMLAQRNADEADPMRRFQVRVGLSQNVDNAVTDINGRPNIAGSGINLAQRIMNLADGQQILVADAVHDTLRAREKYMRAFRSYSTHVKHGQPITAHQYIQPGLPGLNAEVPTVFLVAPPKPPERLSLFDGYYLAHAWKHQAEIGATRDRYAVAVLLDMLADDSAERKTRSRFDPPATKVHGEAVLSFSEQLKWYDNQDFWVVANYSEFVNQKLAHIADCFEYVLGRPRVFVSDEGKRRVCGEFPSICAELTLPCSGA
jgi:class 3 adenylate cyclase